MINQGLTIMATGMLVVFAFLTIMVIAMRLMSNILLRFFPEKEEAVALRFTSAAQTDELELAVVIAAAHMGSK